MFGLSKGDGNMKYNAKEIAYIFVGIEELGLANAEEVGEYLKEQMKQTIDIATIKLILERLRAKDILSIDSEKRYKVAKVPAPFLSVKMPHLKKWRGIDFEKAISEIDKIFPQGVPLLQKKGFIHSYRLIEIVFENMDPILGGFQVMAKIF